MSISNDDNYYTTDTSDIYVYTVYQKKNLDDHGGVVVIVVGNGHGDTSSNPDETDCISHSTNTLGKDMNPIILPPAMGKK